MDNDSRKKIINRINDLSGTVTLGMDGYIDEVWQVIEKRTDRDKYEVYDRMQDLVKAMLNCREGGFSNEIIHKRRSYGGFCGNTGKALYSLGLHPTMIGMFGKNAIDPVFEPFEDNCELISVGDPATCHILEFGDGKIMFPYNENLLDLSWSAISAYAEKVFRILMESDIIALGYWSSIPAFDEIVESICGNYIKGGKCRRMFFDFADLRKKDRNAFDETMRKLARLNGSPPMTLSVNENEAAQLYGNYDEVFKEEAPEAGIVRVREKTGLDELVIHTPRLAVCSSAAEGVATSDQTFCVSPVITAGAGDTFNAGYIAATLAGLNAKERLISANAAAYYYVSNGGAPGRKELTCEINGIVGI